MIDGEWLTYWTARLAMFVLAMSFVPAVMRRGHWHRVLWTIACLVHVVHVGCAFHFVHHWSHRAAFAATEKRTAEVTGFDWGGGLYLNDLLTLLWLADVAIWWRLAFRDTERDWSRSRAHRAFVAFLLFMAFNATVIFGGPVTRTASAIVCAVLLALHVRERLSRHQDA